MCSARDRHVLLLQSAAALQLLAITLQMIAVEGVYMPCWGECFFCSLSDREAVPADHPAQIKSGGLMLPYSGTSCINAAE